MPATCSEDEDPLDWYLQLRFESESELKSTPSVEGTDSHCPLAITSNVIVHEHLQAASEQKRDLATRSENMIRVMIFTVFPPFSL